MIKVNEICFVLQITDLLFKYASQEPMYVFKYLMKTTREGMSIVLEETGGCVTIRTHKFSPKKTNRKDMEPESSNQKSQNIQPPKARKGDVAKTTPKKLDLKLQGIH